MTEETLNQMTREQAINDLVTPNGKRVGIYHVRNTSLYKPAFESGGELPPELNSMYTDAPRATKAAREYVKRKWDEAAKKSNPGRPKKDTGDNDNGENAS